MKIYHCKEISNKVFRALEKLIPQLCPECEIPSQEYLRQINQSNSSFLFLAEEEEIIGTLTLIITQIPTCKKAWIEDIVVDKGMRGKGIGKRLIEFAVDFAKEQGVSKIDLTSRPERFAANELYKKLGFRRRKTNVYRFEI